LFDVRRIVPDANARPVDAFDAVFSQPRAVIDVVELGKNGHGESGGGDFLYGERHAPPGNVVAKLHLGVKIEGFGRDDVFPVTARRREYVMKIDAVTDREISRRLQLVQHIGADSDLVVQPSQQKR